MLNILTLNLFQKRRNEVSKAKRDTKDPNVIKEAIEIRQGGRTQEVS